MRRIAILSVLLCIFFVVPRASQATTVDMLYQGSGYVPPFYEGKTLWGRETEATFLAVPHTDTGGAVNPSSLIFRWSKNGFIIDTSSGLGKNSFTVPDSILGLPIDIEVEVLSDPDTVVASSMKSFAASAPSVLVYEDNPTYGYMFQNEAGNGAVIKDQEITLTAFPFLFSTATKNNPDIVYSWLADGATTPETGDSVTYRATVDGAGSSSVHLDAEASRFVSQSAKEDFLVQFGKQQTSL